MVVEQLTECDPDAAELPALADLEECVFGLSLRVTFPRPGKQGSFPCGAGTPCCVRAVFVPDERTLVLGDEIQIQQLLDALEHASTVRFGATVRVGVEVPLEVLRSFAPPASEPCPARGPGH